MMFSRATKLIARSLGPRRFCIAEQNLKNAFIGGSGEISRTLSQFLRNGMKLNVLTLYDVAAVNKPLPNHRIHDYCDNQSLTNSRETKELLEALYHLPIAEGAPTLNNSLISDRTTSKADNTCSGLLPHARFLDKIGPNDTRTRRRDCAIAAIRECFHGLTRSPSQEYVNFTAATKTSRRHPSIKDEGKTGILARDLSDVQRNDCDEERSMGRLTRKFKNPEKLLNIEKASYREKVSTSQLMAQALLNNKPRWLREIYGRNGGFSSWFSIRTFMSNNSIPTSRGGCCFRERLKMDNVEDNAITHDIIKEENRIQRMSLGIASVLSNLHTRILSRPTTISDSSNQGSIPAVNEALAVSVYDSFRDRTIPSAPIDLKFDIWCKLEKICALWNRLLRRKEKDDICKKRRRACKTAEEMCLKRGEMCQRKTTDCSETRKQACRKHTTVLCSGRKSCDGDEDDRDFCRNQKCQKRSGTQHEDNDCTGAEEDPCGKLQRTKLVLCERKRSKDTTCTETKEDKCKRKTQEVCQKKQATCEQKKEKDCYDTKKVEPRKKKECPPVKRAPGCPEDHEKEEDC